MRGEEAKQISFFVIYSISYAFMLIKNHKIHPLLLALPSALRARMDVLGHSQCDVSAITGVPQPQISRVLNGARKRLTPAMQELCIYAQLECDCDNSSFSSDPARDVVNLLQNMIGDSAPAAEKMKAVLRSLAPLLADYRRQPAP